MSRHNDAVPAPLLWAVGLSGFSALIYEILWLRLVSDAFGYSAYAVSTVLAVFLGGLALGSAAGDRLARRFRGALPRLYAGAELALAAYGSLSAYLISGVAQLLVRRGISPGEASGWPLWFAAFAAVLLIPTFLMGTAVPLLVAARGGDPRPLGALYGVNTLGAAAGSLAAGAVLLPWTGVRAALWIAAGLNTVSAALALWAARGTRRAPAPAASTSGAGGDGRFILAAAFLIGAAGLIAETGWVRALGSALGSSVYALGLTLFAYLLGHGAGAFMFLRWRRAERWDWRGLGWAALGAAASLAASLALYARLPYLMSRWLPAEAAFSAEVMFQALSALLWVAPAAFFTGFAAPVLLSLWTPAGKRVPYRAGALLAAGTAGSVAGTMLAGFWLLPALGAEGALSLAFWIFLGVGAAAALCRSPGPAFARWSAPVGAALLASLGVLRPAWEPAVVASGVFQFPLHYARARSFSDFLKEARRDRVLSRTEGLTASVTVRETPEGKRYLQVNGKVDASEGRDRVTQTLLGVIPQLVHEFPRKALVIGLGVGGTAAALAQSKAVERIDVVEIEAEVVRAARRFFPSNRGVLDDPRVRVYVDDAGHFLSAPGERYDVIVSEPSNLWVAGSAALFTREHFARVRERLAKGGVFCQWVPGYDLSREEFRTLMATFASVFPRLMMLRGPHDDYFFLGTGEPWEMGYGRMKRTLASLKPLKPLLGPYYQSEPAALLGAMLVSEDLDWRRRAAAAPIHSRNRPILEFSAPRSRRGRRADAIYEWLETGLREIVPVWISKVPAEWSVPAYQLKRVGEAALKLGEPRRAYRVLLLAVRLAPQDPEAAVLLARALGLVVSRAASRRLLEDIVRKRPGYAPAYFLLGDALAREGRPAEARSRFREGLEIAPGDRRARRSLESLKPR